MCGHLHDNAFGIESTQASISGHCCSLHDSVDWVNNNVPWGLVAKYFTTSPWLIGCGRVSTYVYTVIQSKRVRFSCFAILIGCVEVFGISFDGPSSCSQPHLATWMGCFWCLHFHSSQGMVMEGPDWLQDDSDAKKKFIPMWFLLITADRGRLAAIGHDQWVKI